MNTKKKSNNQHLGYQLAKWVLFIPSLICLLVYSLAVIVELLMIRAKSSDHKIADVANARKWFIYLAFPFFPEQYFISMLYHAEHGEIKRMVDVYGKRPFSKTLKMYMPFMPKIGALEAYNAKTGNTYEFVS